MKWLTPSQVAEQLNATDEKIRDLIKTGQLAAIDVSLHQGGKARWRISETDLEDFVRRRRTQPPAPAPRRKRRQDEQITRYY